jgi:hypothetical protein
MPPMDMCPVSNPHQPYRGLRQGHTLIFLKSEGVRHSRETRFDKSSCDNYSAGTQPSVASDKRVP